MAVADYLERHKDTLAPDHAERLLESRRRLERLAVQAAELIDLNNRMCLRAPLAARLDRATDTLTLSVGGAEVKLRLNRADPNVPVEVRGEAFSSGYHAGRSVPRDEEEEALRFELETKLESYYQSAHRVLKLFGRIPALAKIRCAAITLVRNNLIEHAEADDGSLYSFGASSAGPRVKPMHGGAPKFNDEGLVPNTRAFVAAIVSGCK